jgi:hypothetical protein
MPLLLLLLGLVTTVAGLVLVASGLPFRDGALDAEILTPGVVATVGGLLLVGLGLAVRALRNIERVLASRPMPHVSHAGEAAATAVADALDTSVRFPFPSAPKTDPEAASSGADDPAAIGDRAAPARVRMKFPALTRREDRPVVEGADASITPQDAAPAEEDLAEGKSPTSVGLAANGGPVPSRVAPPRQRPRPTTDNANGSAPKVFWPVGPGRDGQGTAAQPIASVPPSVAEPAHAEAKLEVSVAGASAPSVTVLKSGVVEGMAYTLYSDGSIEAQLPQGRLRFGSIDALRDHIESTT